MKRKVRAVLPLATLLVIGSICGCSSGASTEKPFSADPTGSAVSDDYLEKSSVELATQLGIDNPPSVEVVRVIDLNDWADTLVACLNTAGYSVTKTPDGEGVDFSAVSDESLAKSFRLAQYVCEMSYPVAQKYMEPLTEDQLESLYKYRSDELIDCLEANGASVVVTPPSWEVFLETGGAWSPYEEVRPDPATYATLEKNCPQTPESLY